jgi:hypothetical protein
MSQRAMTGTGRALSGMFVLLMTFDVVIKLLDLAIVDETMSRLGWWAGSGQLIGFLEFVCLALYVIPSTAILGALLMTGVLGGAVATHLRVQSPLFTHQFFAVYLGLFMWGGLWLRYAALRRVIPILRV